ncbi:hypothetical protein FIE12Z_2981 [Fusarium flagelliforme]|uniref:BZIP domain-containing protein n=1 Tax=Fusarium flagelliforme TaxID=2675880 RepID=A0A395MYZ0_9HYPO|nr:hypothetical protein FIE12Z_2981 [Fusarium flagelliforme]
MENTESSAPSQLATDEAEKKQRRKLQNRLNQRARRSRIGNDDQSKIRTKQQNPGFGVKLWKLDEFNLETKPGSSRRKHYPAEISKSYTFALEADRRLFLTSMYSGTLSASDVELYSQQLDIQKRLASASQLACPLSDHLLYLINFNAFRGLFFNKVTLTKLVDHLAVGPGRTEKLNIMLGLKKDAICVALGHDMPPDLQPTPLQSEIVHANWIDLIPIPRMRDNLIMRQDHFNHRLFINDVIGNLLEDVMINKYGEGTGPRSRLKLKGKSSDFASDRSSMIVWGEPHRMESWEVTAEFLQRWGWAVEGCHELMRATNQWRAVRGEAPLMLETTKNGHLGYSD